MLASRAEQGRGVIDMEAPKTLHNPSEDEVAREYERMGGVPIDRSGILTRLMADIAFFNGGHLTWGHTKVSWYRQDRDSYVTIERVKEGVRA
jgi:hypothetical protein